MVDVTVPRLTRSGYVTEIVAARRDCDRDNRREEVVLARPPMGSGYGPRNGNMIKVTECLKLSFHLPDVAYC